MRSFMLVALATVLSPGMQNSVDLKYLQFLMRSEEIKNYDWASHVLQYSLSKVRRFLYVISSSDVSKRHGLYFYSSYLPMFAVSVGNSICFICFPYYYFYHLY
jgi:hypothetical protein